MEIEIFTLCDFAQDNQQKLTVVGTFDSLWATQFPVLHPFCSVACRLRFSNKDKGEHNFMLKLIDSTGRQVIPECNGIFTIGESPAGYSSINLVANYGQLQFSSAGRYSFELYVDGEWASGLPLNVAQAA